MKLLKQTLLRKLCIVMQNLSSRNRAKRSQNPNSDKDRKYNRLRKLLMKKRNIYIHWTFATTVSGFECLGYYCSLRFNRPLAVFFRSVFFSMLAFYIIYYSAIRGIWLARAVMIELIGDACMYMERPGIVSVVQDINGRSCVSKTLRILIRCPEWLIVGYVTSNPDTTIWIGLYDILINANVYKEN